mmetsp:Transcript_122979/g.358952  ORF Transcript_122979/g.358952 Transcript_122979/m.358952 type:complete len:200 (+) Transcript_122979:2282-2881(+)
MGPGIDLPSLDAAVSTVQLLRHHHLLLKQVSAISQLAVIWIDTRREWQMGCGWILALRCCWMPSRVRDGMALCWQLCRIGASLDVQEGTWVGLFCIGNCKLHVQLIPARTTPGPMIIYRLLKLAAHQLAPVDEVALLCPIRRTVLIHAQVHALKELVSKGRLVVEKCLHLCNAVESAGRTNRRNCRYLRPGCALQARVE